ncbi:bifunctional diaminohydroxyphosphoribosylaminopyrimidine deaminase/5-amino-6-(5-phosphoribosylamino)uracil reductase RibD [Calidifontibacillus oryziterrae]|uniref:bifunctional diaminohydroxyphosphoribosylaminopyrimidine deaminase/5-amino-6-(5-phosphoribosylamino)uracil reductase RibD n=1 Tax=Calidifontibacillus oryziterrae TaxID=1191699 RepID=UPI000318644D|nr:bifunctional diaminohydroxyphosphoribosylaminopyrimidine deaminase/5-amino-6-(5-phosphoribosylamino)uracil reductase RibD [Calidifontibacillus oryziterrae]
MTDLDFMTLALQLAKSTKGQTSPNPLVGAVLVKDHQIVGLGASLKAEDPHAGIIAIQMAGAKARNATLYITLEPSVDYGRSLSCIDMIISSQIDRIVIATLNPDPKHKGEGVKSLKIAGLKVDIGVLKEKADEVNKVFFHFIKLGMPYVTLKAAMTMDGKAATIAGDQLVPCEDTRLDIHQYRHEHDAVVTGVNTILRNDPYLTTRLPLGGKNPIRIVLDTNLRTPLDAKVINDHCVDTWIVVSRYAPTDKVLSMKSKNVEIIQLAEEKINIVSLLKLLGKKGISSLFVEGGPQILGSFMQSKVVNEIVTYISPKIVCGANAPTSIGGEGIGMMNNAIQQKIKSIEQIGEDIKIVSSPIWDHE